MVNKSDMDNYCRHRKLEEVYVLAEVDWLRRQEDVRRAIEERGLKIHPFVYDKETNQCVELIEGQSTAWGVDSVNDAEETMPADLKMEMKQCEVR